MRRPSAVLPTVLQVGALTLDPGKYRVTKRGVEVQLMPRDFALLEFLMRNVDVVFSAEALLQRVWNDDSEATSDALRTSIKRLRRKLDDGGDTQMTANLKSAEKADSTKMARVAEVTKPKGGLNIVNRPKPEPGAQQVRLRVEACGVCHSDSFCMEGTWPGLSYPLVPGHEIVGIVDEVGPDVVRFKKGDRVGVGWHGGHCGECDPCRSGDFIICQKLQIPGINRDGGYCEYVVFPETVCAMVPA